MNILYKDKLCGEGGVIYDTYKVENVPVILSRVYTEMPKGTIDTDLSRWPNGVIIAEKEDYSSFIVFSNSTSKEKELRSNLEKFTELMANIIYNRNG